MMSLLFSSHLMACAWGLIGHFYLVMDCSLGYPVTTATSVGTALPDGSMDMNHNWILTAHKSPSPDNMCEPFAVYIWSLHWSVMTITSIGYGDFSPQRKSEYVVCIVCMFLGGIMWAAPQAVPLFTAPLAIAMLCFAMQFCFLLCDVLLCYALLRLALLCFGVLCLAVLCFAML